MRCSTVRAKIIDAIEGATIDNKAGHRDVFRHIDNGMRIRETGISRTFHVGMVSPPRRAQAFTTTDLYSVLFEVQVYYADSPAIEDRIGLDCERVHRALDQIAVENADLATIDIEAGAIAEFEGHITCAFTISCNYRLDDGV